MTQEESMEDSDKTDEIPLLTCSPVLHDVAMEQLAQVLRLTITQIDGELCAITDAVLMRQSTRYMAVARKYQRIGSMCDASPRKMHCR